MADEKKYTAREAAIAVLAKAQEILAKSSIIKKDEPEALKKSAEYTSGFHTIEYFEPMNKAEVMEKAQAARQKGVHNQHRGSDAGHSTAGEATRVKENLPPKHRKAMEGDIKKLHQATLKDLQSMPKPNLPKSEMLCSEHALGKTEGVEIVKAEKCAKCMSKSEFAELYEDLAKMEKAENKDAPSNPMKPKIEEKPIERDNKNFEVQKEGSNSPADARQAPIEKPAAGIAEKNGNPKAGSVPGKGVHKLSFFMGHRHNKKAGNKPPASEK